jgi:hypothetical protein
MHLADTGHQRAKDPESRHETGQKDGLAAVPVEELLRAVQALGGDEYVSPPGSGLTQRDALYIRAWLRFRLHAGIAAAKI